MAKYNNRQDFRDSPRIQINRNHFIKANVLFVVDEEGEVLGEMSRQDALREAQERDLDLIEISPKANPPVAKIMSWSKFKYELTKKKKERKKNKGAEQKEMWFKAFIDEGDLNHKLKRVEDFLKKKHPVKIQIRATGRTTTEHLQTLMNKILERLEDKIESDSRPKREGRNLSIILRPKK